MWGVFVFCLFALKKTMSTVFVLLTFVKLKNCLSASVDRVLWVLIFFFDVLTQLVGAKSHLENWT